MKLVRYGEFGRENLGLLDNQGRIRSLPNEFPDDEDLFPALSEISRVDMETLKIVENNPRMGPCIKHVGKLICVGLNYVEHAGESKMEIPKEPILFMKATSSICGPDDDVVIPKGAEKTDWEVELGVVIGKTGAYIAQHDALDFVAGYCVVNDISDRGFQFDGTGQWVKGKSADTFGPIGPWFITRDEIPDPQKLDIWLEVNGERVQNSNTANMFFNVKFLVSYISRFMTLHPGDIISTGTPPGVGLGMNPPRYLKPGDTMRLGVEGLGIQCQKVKAWNG